jgi:hypothetical protein
MANVKAAFRSDWMAWAAQSLTAQGYKVKAGDFMETCVRFHNLRRLQISRHPRKVIDSRELSCPSGLEAGLALLRQTVEAGGDLRPHLSRRLTDLDFDDSLLNDWHIYHLHLGTTLEPDGFMKRTGPVLLARFEDDAAYFLAMETHGAWTSQRLLEILDSNWPSVTEPFSLPDVIRAEYEPTDKDVALLRKNHITAISTVGGTPLGPMGGGVTTAGGSAQVSLACTKLTKLLRSWERVVAAHVASEPGPDKALHLEIRGTDAYAVEVSTGTAHKLGAGAA